MASKIAALVLVVAGVGCGGQPPPRVEVLLSADGFPGNVLRSESGTLAGVPPLAGLEIGFDRLLSLEKLGGTKVDPAQFVPGLVQIVWENAPPGSRAVVVDEVYWPAAPVTSANAGRPTISLSTAGNIPAGARLRLHLDGTRIANLDGDPLQGPEDLFVETGPFSVHLATSSVTTAGGPPTLVFSNRGAFDIPAHLKVTEQGMPVSIYVTSGNPGHNEYLVLGPDSGQWHPGNFEVLVDAGAADDFGQTLGTPATLSFQVQ